MPAWLTTLQSWLASVTANPQVAAIFRALLLLVAGLMLMRFVRTLMERSLGSRLSKQQLMLARRVVTYTILILFIASAMRELGFNFGVLLGAAGILTLAVGFASQTSVSNIISGLFMILERSVEVGDVVRIGGTTGEVLAIDLLSTRLRTFDNLSVRIPNETMVKAEITTLTRFPIRRLDLTVGVAYKEDLSQVEKLLQEVADRNPLCLDEPKPVLIAQGFGESSIDYLLGVWVKRENFLMLRNEIYRQIKSAFDAEGIEIPFPHRSLYAGSESEPLPVRMVPAAVDASGTDATTAEATGAEASAADATELPGS